MQMQFRLLVFLVGLFIAMPALAQKRIALLIGNQEYKPGVGQLKNPLNDVRIVGEALKEIGFEVLKPVRNATRIDMLDALERYTTRLREAGDNAVGFIYYSGHGLASRGVNYLIPTDVTRPTTRQLRAYALEQEKILSILQKDAPKAAHYLVIDACRNELQGSRGGKGFLPVSQNSGTLIAFATAPGRTASDIGDIAGPYAKTLAAEIIKPNITDLQMFHNVRVAVAANTDGDQVPWTLDGILRRERLMFGGKTAAFDPPGAAITRQPSPAELLRNAKNCAEVTAVANRTKAYSRLIFDVVRRLNELKCQFSLERELAFHPEASI